MATKKKAAPSWNPYYVPPLSKIQAEAKAAAQAQINSAVGAIPTDATVSGQFAARGRDLAGLDTSYVTFLKNQAAARPTSASPGPVITPAGVGGGAGTASATEAQNAAAASRALGIGFQNQNTALQNAAQGMVTLNQASNRKNMYDAIQQLQTQRAAERAKYGVTYQNELDKRKQQAFQAYQAYLSNQLQAASLGATASFNQGKLNIQQQNADTAAQRAAAAGNKPTGGFTASQRATGKQKVYDFLEQAAKGKSTTTKKKMQRWDIQVTEPQAAGPPQIKHLTYYQTELGVTPAAVLAKMKQTYGAAKRITVTPYDTPETTVNSVTPATWNSLYNAGYSRMRTYYPPAQAKAYVIGYLNSIGIHQPKSAASAIAQRPAGSRPSGTGV